MVVAQSQAACRRPEFLRLFFSHGMPRAASPATSELRGIETDLPCLLRRWRWIDAPSAMALALVLTIFGYGQRLVMAPLSSAVLSTVKPVSAGAASGIYGTSAQIANAAGVAAIGAVFFAIESNQSSRLALLAACALFALSIIACAAFLTWMRQVTG
jgi:hypothetical protein